MTIMYPIFWYADEPFFSHVEVNNLKPYYEEEYIVSVGALWNSYEQYPLVIGVRTRVLSSVIRLMLLVLVYKALSFFCNEHRRSHAQSILALMTTCRIFSDQTTEGGHS